MKHAIKNLENFINIYQITVSIYQGSCLEFSVGFSLWDTVLMVCITWKECPQPVSDGGAVKLSRIERNHVFFPIVIHLNPKRYEKYGRVYLLV